MLGMRAAQEAVKLWCLCKLPYDEERPMLACDHCGDWFHYDCCGLRPPGDDEDDDTVAPPDFKCPACCLKARAPTCLAPKITRTNQQRLKGQAVAQVPCGAMEASHMVSHRAVHP